MRIALLSYRSKTHCGGQGVYVRHLSRGLVELGHDVEVFSGQPYPQQLDPRVRLTEVPSLDLYREPDPFRVPRPSEIRDSIDLLELLTTWTAGFPEPRTFTLRVARLLADRTTDFDVTHDNQSLGGGRTDPWDHAECAMALTAAGLLEPARAAFDWSRREQRPDGSWPIQIRAGVVEDVNSDSNFCAYFVTGVWHYVLVTSDESFAEAMWPVVQKAIDFVIDLQVGYGEICWARSEAGPLPEALLTGCASAFHSIRCALALAVLVGEPQPEWELALGRLGHAIIAHPEGFM